MASYRAEISDGLAQIYKDGMLTDLGREVVTLARLAGVPHRQGHREPPTAEDIAEFEAWKAQIKPLLDKGWDRGWLEATYDDGDQIVEAAPHRWVFDESQEDYDRRYAAWKALQPERVTFPVHRGGRVSAVEPELSGDPDA